MNLNPRALPRSHGPLALVALTAVVVSVGALVKTRHGMNMTPDSVSYYSAASSFVETGRPYQTWSESLSSRHYPPGWSILVGSLSVLTSISLETAARIINAVAAAVGVLLVFFAAGGRRGVTTVSAAAALFVALNYDYYEHATKALTELVFLAMVIAALLCAERCRLQPKGKWLVLGGLAACASVSFRYVGVACLVAFLPGLLASGERWRAGMQRFATVCGIALAPLLIWYYLAPGNGLSQGVDHLSSASRAGLSEARLSLRELASLVVGEGRANGGSLWSTASELFGGIMLFLPLISVLLAAILCRPNPSLPTSSRVVWTVILRLRLEPWLAFLASYLAIIAFQRWLIDREIIGRYWLPYLVVSVVIEARCIAAVWSIADSKRPQRSVVAVSAVAMCFVAATSLVHGQRIFTDVADDDRLWGGLNSQAYQESQLLRELGGLPVELILTDSEFLVGFYAPNANEVGIQCPGGSPSRSTQDLLNEAVGGYLAVFNGCANESALDALNQLRRLDLVIEEPAVGVLFELQDG